MLPRDSSAVGNVRESASPDGYFLSPGWIREVGRAVQADNFGRAFSLNLAYFVRNLPPGLRTSYDGSAQLVIFARVVRGSVNWIGVGTEPPAEKIHLVLKSDYAVARKLFRGESTVLSSFFTRKLKVEAASEFSAWPMLATRSLSVAKSVLRIARQVPTRFAPRS